MSFCRLPAYCLALLTFAPLASAADAPSMTPMDLLNLTRLSSPSLSVRGDLAFVRSDSDWDENREVKNIWLKRAGEESPFALTRGIENKSNPVWSPDGRLVAYLAKPEKPAEDDEEVSDGERRKSLWFVNIEDPSVPPRRVPHAADIEAFEWHPDGDALYFIADTPSEELDRRKRDKDDMFAFDEPQMPRHLWRYVLADDQVAPLTSDDARYVLDFDLADDGETLALVFGPSTTIDARHDADVWVADADGGNLRRVTQNSYAERRVELAPDGKAILYTADVNAAGDYYYDANLFTHEVGKRKPRLLLGKHDFEVEDAHWSNKPGEILIRANMGVRSELWQVTRNGRARQLTDGKHTLGQWSYSRALNRSSFLRAAPGDPGDAWSYHHDDGELQRLTRFHEDLAERYALPEERLLSWRGPGGERLEAVLALPAGYDPARRYPLIVISHGGPRSSSQYGQFSWSRYVPVATGMGYAVVLPNYRGGRGYGDDFMRDMVGAYYRNAHLDVLSTVDHLVETGIADPDKLVKMGWSAGGHMTNKIITITDRFKAASSGAGASEWISMYGESDTRYGRTAWFGGSPWEKDAPLDVYREQSTLHDMWKVTTPTLVFVGGSDVRVPPTQSILTFRALRAAGVPTKLYIAKREPHGFRELRHRLFRINAELEWFERYVHGRDYDWQAPPPMPEKEKAD